MELECEIPLLLISGGTVGPSNTGSSGVEVVSVYPSTGCDVTIPDMPMQEGSHRSLHNLLFVYPQTLLACNGLISQEEATCDALNLKDLHTWAHHSFPNERKHNSMADFYCGDGYGRRTYKELCAKEDQLKIERKKGVYAAQTVRLGKQSIIAGGMVFDNKGHKI